MYEITIFFCFFVVSTIYLEYTNTRYSIKIILSIYIVILVKNVYFIQFIQIILYKYDKIKRTLVSF